MSGPEQLQRLAQVEAIAWALADLCSGIGASPDLALRLFKVAGKAEECRNELRRIADDLRKQQNSGIAA